MIERKAIADPRATIMTDNAEPREAEMPHDGELVVRHGPLCMVQMLGVALRSTAVAIATQIRRHHGVMPRQHRRDAVPGQMGLRIAVQQQQRRPLARDVGRDPRLTRVDVVAHKRLEKDGRSWL